MANETAVANDVEIVEATEAELKKAATATGSLTTCMVKDIGNNYYRPEEAFVWVEEKLKALRESYLSVGFQSTFEVYSDKWGKIRLSGGGHHRLEALRRAVEEGIAPRIKGLFQNDAGEWCVKVVRKSYTKEEMMKSFLLENAEAWNQDAKQNTCMMVAQVQSYLTNILNDSATVDEFIESVRSPWKLNLDERAFTRLKNAGAVGASTINQYLGNNTYPRSVISMAIDVMSGKTKEAKHFRDIAQNLPNVTLAYKMKQLFTEVDDDGDKILISKKDQEKLAKKIEREALTRTDIEDAQKLKSDQGLSPEAALEAIVVQKKEAKEAGKPKKEEPEKKVEKPAEIFMRVLKHAATSSDLGCPELSKAQVKEAKEHFKRIGNNLKAASDKLGL